MPNNAFPRDRFDDVPREQNRVGAHRAENPRMRTGLVLLWAAAAVIVLFLAGVFGSLVVTGGIQLGSSPVPSASSTAVMAEIDTDYSVLVLNASPDDANLETARALVVAAGWADDQVSVTQADERDFEQTTVYYVDDADAAAALGLAEVIGTTLVVQSDAYAQSDGSDKELTVVLGVDFGS